MRRLPMIAGALGVLAAVAVGYLWFIGDPGTVVPERYPKRPITILVGAARDHDDQPSVVDRLARALVQAARESPGFNGALEIENIEGRGGAGGVAKLLAESADGYHVLLVTAQYALADARGDEFRAPGSLEDMRVLGIVARLDPVLAARNDAPWTSIDDLRTEKRLISVGSGPQWSMISLFAYDLFLRSGELLEPWTFADLRPQAEKLAQGEAAHPLFVLPRAWVERPDLADRLRVLDRPAPRDLASTTPPFQDWAALAVRRGTPDEARAVLADAFAAASKHEFFARQAAEAGFTPQWLGDEEARRWIANDCAAYRDFLAGYRAFLAGE